MKMTVSFRVFLAVLFFSEIVCVPPDYSKELEPKFWHDGAHEELLAEIKKERQEGRAKNIIIFLGDGMGVSTVTAARILAGQQQGKGYKGEEHHLTMDKFPYTGLAKTYNVNTQITDSAAAATAFLCGVKANQETVGVGPKAKKGDCKASKEHAVDSILHWAHKAGKSTGIVTTMRVTHGTPSAAYAHSSNRYWEHYVDAKQNSSDCLDIASQLVLKNSFINVVMGGGRERFCSPGQKTYRGDSIAECKRKDGKDLIYDWIVDKAQNNKSYAYVYDKNGLDKIAPDGVDHLLGLFADSHMTWELKRNKSLEPSVNEMTKRALAILQKNKNGFFLLVEGGKIDSGHHKNQAAHALQEVIALDEAIKSALELTNKEDTLIVVTADHSHTFSISGYALRGNPILGVNNQPIDEITQYVNDKMRFTTIVYGNGPGKIVHQLNRKNLSGIHTELEQDYTFIAAVSLNDSTHGGEDVSIYASGPHSFLFNGVHEQSYIPHAMAYVSCIGPYGEGGKKCASEGGKKIASDKAAPLHYCWALIFLTMINKFIS